MKICPACQRENSDGAGFCSACGAVLPATTAARAADAGDTPPPLPSNAPPPPAGQAAPYYAPPAPPRRGLSPWAWVGIGCGLFTLLGIGGCVAFIAVVGKQVSSEMQKPINREEILASLGDTPRYPNAQFDDNGTKAGRIGLNLTKRLIPARSSVVAAFVTRDDADKILSWYDAEMKKRGFQSGASAGGTGLSGGPNGARQRQYRKDDDVAIVQVQRGSGAAAQGASMIILMRFNGVQKGARF